MNTLERLTAALGLATGLGGCMAGPPVQPGYQPRQPSGYVPVNDSYAPPTPLDGSSQYPYQQQIPVSPGYDGNVYYAPPPVAPQYYTPQYFGSPLITITPGIPFFPNREHRDRQPEYRVPPPAVYAPQQRFAPPPVMQAAPPAAPPPPRPMMAPPPRQAAPSPAQHPFGGRPFSAKDPTTVPSV